MRVFSSLFQLSEKVIEKLTFFLFSAMTVIVFAQVVSRYALNTSIYWSEEFARFSMIWIAFLGAAMGMKSDSHTRIEFFVNLLPAGLQKVVGVFNRLLCIVFIGFISYYAISMLGFTMKTLSSAMRIPVGIIHMILPIAGVFMIIYLLGEIVQLFSAKSNRKAEEEREELVC